MAHFEAFDSLEEMQAAMREREDAANARLTPEQKEVDWGDCWVQAGDDMLIFGRCMTRDEVRTSEQECGAPPDEVEWSCASIDEAHGRGYRYGQAWSVLEPDGEYGSTHIASMLGRITQEDLDYARELGWSSDRIVVAAADAAETDRPLPHLYVRISALVRAAREKQGERR